MSRLLRPKASSSIACTIDSMRASGPTATIALARAISSKSARRFLTRRLLAFYFCPCSAPFGLCAPVGLLRRLPVTIFADTTRQEWPSSRQHFR
jgi:hypothetical protein